jgi:hypothetical protein
MNKDFQAAFAANMSRSSSLVEGQFIPAAKPEQMNISGYVRDGRIYGQDFSRLGGILRANVDVTVHIYEDIAYNRLLEKGDGTYNNLQVILIGWKVEENSNGYTDWLQKTPVYETKQTLKEVRCGFFLRPGVARWGLKKYDPFWDEYIVNTVKLGVNPDITRNDDISL